MLDVVIIGAGPAGLSAVIYAMRAKLDTLVLEGQGIGGQVLSTYEVDNYPALPGISGMDLGRQMREHAEKLGAKILPENVLEIQDFTTYKKVITQQNEYETKTVVITAGAHHSLLGVPGEKELTGMGVSYCATCDGAFYKNAEVAVVGGGDVAVEDAIFLARGCSKVYLIHRRDELRSAKILQEALFALPNVEIIWNSEVSTIRGEEEVEGVLLHNKVTGEDKELSVEGVFIAIGIEPTTGAFQSLLETDEKGYICAGEDCKTSVPGIFAAGDVRTKRLRQIITAAADGANAITSVQDYLLENL